MDPNNKLAPIDPLPCPVNGLCSNGFLRECHPTDLFTPSETHESCHLSNNSLDFIARLQSKLTRFTMNDICSYCSISKKLCPSHNAGLPEFLLPDLLLEDEKQTFTQVLPHLDTKIFQYHNNSLSHTPHFIKNDLPFSFSCYMFLFLKEGIGIIISMSFSFLIYAVNIFFMILKAYPLYTFCVFGLILALRFLYNIKTQRRGIHSQVAKLREMAYNELRVSETPRCVSHIRDEILFELSPTNLRERRKLMKDVWPKVVKEVMMDSRVRKFERALGGLPVDHWEWMSSWSSSKKSR